MRTTTLALTAVSAIGFSALQASATTLLIDDFNTAQHVVDIPGAGEVNTSEVADATVLGGYRDLTIENSTGTAQGSELRTINSALAFSNIFSAQSSASIVYDGVGSTGLGGVDLTLGNVNSQFVFDVISFDLDVAIGVLIEDINGLTASFTETLSAGFNPNLAFTEFTTDAGFDFTAANSLSFFVSSNDTVGSVDGAIGSIAISAVPLPASALLLLGGLGGLGAMRRRKNKAAA